MSDVSNAFRSADHPNAPVSNKPRKWMFLRVLAVLAIVVLLAGLFLPVTRSARPAALRMSCSNNLKQIALALLDYQEVYGTLPPAYVADADGTPMHSWRVLILPFLHEDGLYDKYRFDEPWDGPNNRQLAAQIPAVYRCPGFSPQRDRTAAATENASLTQYLVLCDAKSIFPGSSAMNTRAIEDGAGQTLLVVEVDSESVLWMAPRDIDVAGFARVLDGKHTQRRSHTGGLNSAMADGSVLFLSDTSERAMLEGLSTASGGEDLQDF